MSWITKERTNSVATRVCRISKCTVKQRSLPQESQKPFHLTPWDLQCLPSHYAQYGLVFTTHGEVEPRGMSAILDQLKHSLSTALSHFFPLSGRLATQPHVFINCKDPPGAGFVESIADVTVSDVLSDHAVTTLFPYLFPLEPGTYNTQGHTLPLLLVQVTKLVDGVFIAISCNHAVADGISFWHFINSWAEICRSQNSKDCFISHPPVTTRTSSNYHHSVLSLHNTTANSTRQRFFHFTSKTVANIKAKANAECNNNTTNLISSFQALAAFTWRSVTHARRLLSNQNTTCVVLIDGRSRQDPPLSEHYFGNCTQKGFVTCTVGELLENNLGRVASMLHKEISNHTFRSNTRPALEEFSKPPSLLSDRDSADPGALLFGSSTKFDLYGNDFGWGNPIALRWFANKVDGVVQSVPGRERGSVDLMICLRSEAMDALGMDDEFMHAVSPTNSNMQSGQRSRY